MNQYDVAVIGNGMMGAAASRYLSQSGLRVAAIGPGEPSDWQAHDGVFASHYDQGRITRIVDADPVWATLAARSIAEYPTLAQQSGIRFHEPVGCLRVSADPGLPGDTLDASTEIGRERGAQLGSLKGAQLSEHFPFLGFPDSAASTHETGGAGYVNPRSLVQAQLTCAAQQGATVLRETAVALERKEGAWHVRTDAGGTHRAQRVLLATGAFTNGLLAERPLDLRPKAVTILLARISESEAQRLASMPSIIYRLLPHETLVSIYCLPPVRYPDGSIYIKIGGTFHDAIWVHSQAELREWFHGPGSVDRSEDVRDVLLGMLPGLRAEAFDTRPCTVTYTAHDRPYVDQLEEGLFVAAGGCGAAAKSSNEIGRIAALLVENDGWSYDLPAETFRAVFKGEA